MKRYFPMVDQKKEMRTCMKCKKEKPVGDGYLKLGGMFFCCKDCCDAPDKKKDAEGDGPKVCEFC